MKKKLIIAIPVFLLLAVAFYCFFPVRVGHITEFSYWSGHYWYGYHTYALEMVDDAAWAVESFEPTDGMWGDIPQVPWERRRVLSEEELRAFEALVVGELHVPEWPPSTGPDPNSVTDQDSWAITFTYNGKVFKKDGYAEFPDGLSRIAEALSVPEAAADPK